MGQQTERSNFTNGNSDDITKAVEGLDIFTKNYCMNCQKTEQSNDLVFRCSECVFKDKSGKCLIKVSQIRINITIQWKNSDLWVHIDFSEIFNADC